MGAQAGGPAILSARPHSGNGLTVGVLGGGPAAGAAALALARAGILVTLYRTPLRGEKPCGGGVTSPLLAHLDDVVRDLPSVRPEVVVVEAGADGGSAVRVAVDGLRIFRRRDLDGAIVAAAVAAGASLRECRVVALGLGRDGVEVTYADGSGNAVTVRHEWLVAGDGARGLSRRTLGLVPEGDSVGLGASLEGVTTREMVVAFPDAGDAYAWIFPRPGGVSVGLGYGVGELSDGLARAQLENFLARHVPEASRFPGARYRYPIPVWGPWTGRAVATGIARRTLLVGDAAAVADPLTREGIRPAYVSGLAAAAAIVEGAPHSYRDRLDAELAPELDRAARAAGHFFEGRVALAMVPAARLVPGIRRTLADLLSGAQSYRGLRRRLVRAAVGLGPG